MGAWVDHPLSAFVSDAVLYGGTSHVQYSGGVLSRLGTGSFWRFALPDIVLGPADVTEVEITYGAAGQNPSTAFNVTLVIALDALSGATFDDFSDLGTTKIDPANDNAVTTDTQTYTLTVGPGVYVPDNAAGEQANFDTYVATGARPYVMFRNSGNVTTIAKIRTRVLDGTAAPAATRIRRDARLRQFPLDYGTPRRNFPESKAYQASNRNGGGYR
jgi:hypothetical protein